MVRFCPKCGRMYTDPPAVSRMPGGADICPACGMQEALEAMRNHFGKRIISNFYKITGYGPVKYIEFQIECDVPAGTAEPDPPPEFYKELRIALALQLGVDSDHLERITAEEYIEATGGNDE